MIHIKNNYYIGSDSAQFILIEKATIQTGENAGKETSNNNGYYSTVSAALNGFIKIQCRELVAENDYELSEALQMFKNVEMEMAELFAQFDLKKGGIINVTNQ